MKSYLKRIFLLVFPASHAMKKPKKAPKTRPISLLSVGNQSESARLYSRLLYNVLGLCGGFFSPPTSDPHLVFPWQSRPKLFLKGKVWIAAVLSLWVLWNVRNNWADWRRGRPLTPNLPKKIREKVIFFCFFVSKIAHHKDMTTDLLTVLESAFRKLHLCNLELWAAQSPFEFKLIADLTATTS